MRPLLAVAAAAVFVVPSATDLRTAVKPDRVAIYVTTASEGPVRFRAYATKGGPQSRTTGESVGGPLAGALQSDAGVVPLYGTSTTTPASFTSDFPVGDLVFEAVDGATKLRVDVVPYTSDSRTKRVRGEGSRVVVRRVGSSLTVWSR
jgi:hypothetical protein